MREIELINEGENLPENAMLVTMDVKALFTNTPQDEGAQCVGEALSEEPHGKIPPQFLVRLLEIIQEFNIFEFNGHLHV